MAGPADGDSTAKNGFRSLREAMVAEQLEARGIRDAGVLSAMRSVPREGFLPEALHASAYDDSPLPLLAGQTISQPYIVARMAEVLALKPGDRVLEIGSGSGYSAAVLSEIAREVFTIERHRSLADYATERLAALGYDRVHVRRGNGVRGWPEQAPFDAIVLTAACPRVPEALHRQLAVGGRLVLPLGHAGGIQELTLIERVSDDEFVQEELGAVRFVPLVDDETDEVR